MRYKVEQAGRLRNKGSLLRPEFLPSPDPLPLVRPQTINRNGLISNIPDLGRWSTDRAQRFGYGHRTRCRRTGLGAFTPDENIEHRIMNDFGRELRRDPFELAR